MSALHAAVARAIADQLWHRMDKYDKPASLDAAAAAAIRVCLAEAQRAVEALTYEPVPTPVLIYRDDVLAVLAALAEEQA